MKKHLFTIICLCASLFAAHPQNARNGYEVSPNGMLRILVVFADVVDDPDSSSVPGWNAGQLPRYKDSIQYNVIDQMQDGILIQVFPNPNNGFFNIVAADDSIVIEDIVIDDYRGNPVFKQSNLYCEKCEVRLTEPGTYYARVHTNKDTVLKKIVVR